MAYFAGPNNIKLDTGSGEISVGDTADGFTLSIDDQDIPIRPDRVGPGGIADVLFSGRTVSISFVAMEPDKLSDELAETAATPGVLWGENGFGTAPTPGDMAIENGHFMTLTLEPVDTDGTNLIYLKAEKAISVNNMQMYVGARDIARVPLTFLLIPGDSTPEFTLSNTSIT